MSSAALSRLAMASSVASKACLSSAIMSARRVELMELASTVVSLEYLLDFLEILEVPEVPSSSASWLFSCLTLLRFLAKVPEYSL